MLVFVSKHDHDSCLFLPTLSPAIRMLPPPSGQRKRVSAPSLPAELWIYIHHLATRELSPLAEVFGNAAATEDPLSDRDMLRFLQAARSLGRVCRLWNGLAQELLYQNVWVNNRFASLSAALERPDTARLVRSIRLSSTRFDHNAVILRKCPQVEVLVQPEFPRSERLYAVNDLQLPPLPCLRRLHWIESWWSSELLHVVLQAAPNLEHISLASSWTIGFDAVAPESFPTFPRLKTLSLTRLNRNFELLILHTDLQHLTRLTIDPVRLAWKDFPVLPALHALELVEHPRPTAINFPTIFALCPNLRDLRYDARSRAVYPGDEERAPSSIACVRLRVAPQNLLMEERDLRVFLEPAFALERIVLEGDWTGFLAGNAPFQSVKELLDERGCQVESPEGNVLRNRAPSEMSTRPGLP
ncbi:hypothetical protein C8R43DRAFT_1005396 [Mycena crocata]|nr:hypothetical protein C8R43DRAFT_1005396 [Mycena crocata]